MTPCAPGNAGTASLPRSALGLPAALAMAALLAVAPGLRAQEIRGVALGPDDEPLADVPVALHRVGGGSGAFAGATTADADGRFRFRIEPGDSALYFAAMRYDGRMYIGPPVRAGTGDVPDYELRAVPDAEAGAVASALSGGAIGGTPGAPAPGSGLPVRPARQGGPDDTGALWLVAILAVVAAGIFVVTAPGYRRRRTRDALIELATVENRLADGPDEAERERLARRRDSLRGRLAPRS